MGRDWTYRGNQILSTTFSALTTVWSSVGLPPSAIYLDDQLSSVRTAFCTFDHVVGWLMELGGGRHNEFVYNKLIGSANLHMDERGGGGTSCAKPGHLPYDFLTRVPYKSAPWAKCVSPSTPSALRERLTSGAFRNNRLCVVYMLYASDTHACTRRQARMFHEVPLLVHSDAECVNIALCTCFSAVRLSTPPNKNVASGVPRVSRLAMC